MNRYFRQLIDQASPDPNPYIMKGLATFYIRESIRYLDNTFREAAKRFPPGLEYLGATKCTPYEEWLELTKARGNRREFDLAKSDVYTVKFNFRFEGVPLRPKYIQLIYLGPAGTFRLSGGLYQAFPVLTDRIISPTKNNVFIGLFRYKVTFSQIYHNVFINDKINPINITWAPIYKKKRGVGVQVPSTTNAKTIALHYILGKYGLSETFQRYLGFTPIVGEAEINKNNYPAAEWVIARSVQVAPVGYIGYHYKPTTIRMAIPVQYWNNKTKSFVGGVFYIIDHFPGQIQKDWLDHSTHWLILLGHIIKSGLHSKGKLYEWMIEHYNCIEDYIDVDTVMELRDLGYEANSIYDLLNIIIENYDDWVIRYSELNSSMFDKTLKVLYFIFFDLTSNIFRMNFELSRQGNKKFTLQDIDGIFRRYIRQRGIYKLTSRHQAAAPVSVPGDSFYQCVSMLGQQEITSTKHASLAGQNFEVDPSMMEAGSILYLSRSHPHPTGRINPYIHFDVSTGRVLPHPELEEARNKLTAMLSNSFVIEDIVDISEDELMEEDI